MEQIMQKKMEGESKIQSKPREKKKSKKQLAPYHGAISAPYDLAPYFVPWRHTGAIKPCPPRTFGHFQKA